MPEGTAWHYSSLRSEDLAACYLTAIIDSAGWFLHHYRCAVTLCPCKPTSKAANTTAQAERHRRHLAKNACACAPATPRMRRYAQKLAVAS